MFEDTVRSIMEQLFQRELTGVETVDRKSIAEWDSLKHVQLLFALEDEYDIRIEETDMQRLNSLYDIVEYLIQHAS